MILVGNEPIPDDRLRALINDELKSFIGDSMKTVESLNQEFLKNNFNSLTHRVEGKDFLR